MPIISAFPTGESTVDYTGPKSGLPSLEEGKVAYVTDEKRLYTGNADGTNTQIPNADDVKTDVSDAVSSHNSATDAHASQFAKYLPLAGGKMTGAITGGDNEGYFYKTQGENHNGDRYVKGFAVYQSNPLIAAIHYKKDGKVYSNAHVLLGVDGVEAIVSRNGSETAMLLQPDGVHINNVVTPTTDTMPTPKSYVDAATSAVTPNACKVTLTASGWDSTAKTQSATVSGVLEDESKQLIMPMPAGTSMSAYNEAGIQMTAQGDNSVTFTADTVPTADVEVWVVVQSVNDVTPPTLDQASWDYISKQSLAGNAKNLWAVGDCKKIKLSGTAGKLSLNTELYVYILDFDHDSSTVGGTKDGITFGTFKTALTGGKDICLDDLTFVMNPFPDTNSGGWKNSEMRYNVLGSTNVQNGDATATTATSPVAYSLMSCLPADLRAVMRPMCIYTDNTGGGSDTASFVTTTIDFLPLLAEFEIHGARTYANSAEQNHQAQYKYFKDGNIDPFAADVNDQYVTTKYKYSDQSLEGNWLCRSPSSASGRHFCCVNDTGHETTKKASFSNDVAPMFKV